MIFCGHYQTLIQQGEKMVNGSHLLVTTKGKNIIGHYDPTNETLSIIRLDHKGSQVYASRTLMPIVNLSLNTKEPVAAGILQKSVPSNTSSITIMLYSYFTKTLVPSPLTIETKTDESVQLSPWSLSYSPEGDLLAVHTRSSNSQYIFVCDVSEHYKVVSCIKTTSIEEMIWCETPRGKFIVSTCNDGRLCVFKVNTESIEFVKDYNISSSAISSIQVDHLGKGFYIGTRDGNTFYMDKSTMIVTRSEIVSVDLPVVSISSTKTTLAISHNNGAAQILRTSPISEKREADTVTIDNLSNCGVKSTPNGTFVYVQNDTLVYEKDDHLFSKTNRKRKLEGESDEKSARQHVSDSTKSRDMNRGGHNKDNSRANRGRENRDNRDSRRYGETARDNGRDRRERERDYWRGKERRK